jgi:hypothetical protein
LLGEARFGYQTAQRHPSTHYSTKPAMFSHVVIFWTKPEIANAADELVAGAEKYLRPIAGLKSFHVGRMVKSHRDVVDQSYQVALNLQFENKQAEEAYQVHPLHLEFVEKAFKPNCSRAVIYDFE